MRKTKTEHDFIEKNIVGHNLEQASPNVSDTS